jgi:hypothetical protein
MPDGFDHNSKLYKLVNGIPVMFIAATEGLGFKAIISTRFKNINQQC